VVDSAAKREDGEAFLRSWGEEHDLADAELIVDDSGNVEKAIERETADKSLVLIGATERGLLSRLVTNSLRLSVVNELDCSVGLTERPTGRGVFHRVFGRN